MGVELLASGARYATGVGFRSEGGDRQGLVVGAIFFRWEEGIADERGRELSVRAGREERGVLQMKRRLSKWRGQCL